MNTADDFTYYVPGKITEGENRVSNDMDSINCITSLEYSLRYITLDAREDSPLLDGRGLLKTISIDSPEQSLTQVHVIKAVHDLMPVTLQIRGKVIR